MNPEIQITFDCRDPALLARFWAAVLGYVVQPPPDGYGTWDDALFAMGVPPDQRNNAGAIVDPRAVRPRFFFQKVPEPKLAKNRVHIDVRVAPGSHGPERMEVLELRRGQLEGLGAKFVERHEPGPMSGGFLVMRDPEDNEFCLD